MKNKLSIILFFVTMICSLPAYTISSDKLNNDSGDSKFKIIFWGDRIKDIQELNGLTYEQCMAKFIPKEILNDKYISKYYWDEQLLEYEFFKIGKDTGEQFILTQGYFTIVFDREIIIHGLSKVLINDSARKYDNSDYPVITVKAPINPNNSMFALKPKYFPLFGLLRDHNEKEQKRFLNMFTQEIPKYFEKQGKLIRGKIDLDKILKNKHINQIDEGITNKDIMNWKKVHPGETFTFEAVEEWVNKKKPR